MGITSLFYRKRQTDFSFYPVVDGLGRPEHIKNPYSSSSISMTEEIRALKEGQKEIIIKLDKIIRYLSGNSRDNSRDFTTESKSQSKDGTLDPRYKDLKKKLLLANMKILELQNKSGGEKM